MGDVAPLPVVVSTKNVKLSKRAGKVGLKNLGNTCFMNAGLQCLGHIEPLVSYFLNGDFKRELNSLNPHSSKGELAKTFADLLRALWQSEQKSYDPRTFRKMLRRIAPHLFDGDEQQDVQEFLTFCIDGLHEDLNLVGHRAAARTEKQQKDDDKLRERMGDDSAAALAWLRHLEQGTSFLVDLLQGQLRSSVTCLKCGYGSSHFEPFLYLSLPVARGMSQVSDALGKYLEAEELRGAEKWHCKRCKTKVNARKKIDLWKLPPVLMIHLKRFEFDAKSGQFAKTDNRLNMKLTSFDVAPFCASPQRDGSLYNVVGVANHSGDYGSGHYTATCRVGSSGSTWHNFCDATVKSFDGRNVVTRDTYVIFLVRSQAAPAAASAGAGAGAALLRRQTTARPENWPHSPDSVEAVLRATDATQVRARGSKAAAGPGAGSPTPSSLGAGKRCAGGVADSESAEDSAAGSAAKRRRASGALASPGGCLASPSAAAALGA